MGRGESLYNAVKYNGESHIYKDIAPGKKKKKKISNKIIINRPNRYKYLKAFTTKAVIEVRAV